MWQLISPDVSDSESDLLRALTRANGEAVFETNPEQRAALLQLYEQYDSMKGKPAPALVGTELGAAFVSAVESAYGQIQEGRRLANVRAQLKSGATECPYCGFGEIHDLDHHLARSVYKAFSIYRRNLVPCCHPCNNKKRTAGGTTAAEQFSHPYLDDFPEGQFLVAEAGVSPHAGLRVEFYVLHCDGMTDDVFARLKFQFAKLDLNRRYEAQVVSFVTSQRASIELAAEGGTDSLQAWLRRTRQSIISGFGLNDWRSALVDSLLRSDEFCQGGYQYAFGERQIGV